MRKAYQAGKKKSHIKRVGLSPKLKDNELHPSRNIPGNRMLNFQQSMGNRAVQRLIGSGAIQAKIKIGETKDHYEQEADQVADQVLRHRITPGAEDQKIDVQAKPRQHSTAGEPGVSEEKVIQPDQTDWRIGVPPVEISFPVSSLDTDTRYRLEAIRGTGTEVPQTMRSTAERMLGTTLSDVKIHTGNKVDKLTTDLDARGLTLGRDVFLSSEAAQHSEILAHELQHAAQNSRSELHFWATDQQREDYARLVGRALRSPTLHRQFDPLYGPNRVLNELRARTEPPFARETRLPGGQLSQLTTTSANRTHIQRFFSDYGGEQTFIRDLARYLRRMADALQFQLEPPSRAQDPDEQRATALSWYSVLINERINRIYPIDEQIRHEGEEIINPGQQGRSVTTATAQEQHWRTQMRIYFQGTSSVPHAGFSHEQEGYQANIDRLSLWIIDNWAGLFAGGTPSAIGNSAAALGWGVSDTRNRRTSVLALSSTDQTERQRGERLGISYFSNIYGRYAGAFERLFAEAAALQQSLSSSSSGRNQRAYDFLNGKLPPDGHWFTVRHSLTQHNLNRLNGLGFCWSDSWNQSPSRAAPGDNQYLITAGINQGGGGGTWSHTATRMEN